MERAHREPAVGERPPETEAAAERGVREPSRKQVYLRTVYPLNPGIPHFVDVPGGW